jgi:nucleotide-binding universal stress UspA family protein
MSAIDTGTYDFVSMGTHGRSGFSHFVLGSVAERVVRHSKLPVLTVQARQGSANTITIKRFLVATDYSEHSKRAFSMAAGLAKGFGGSIELLHVWPAPYFGPGYGFDAGAFLDPAQHKSLFDTIRENAAKEMRAFASSIAIPEGVTVATHLESGDASSRILEIIGEKQPDLVVVGTHGRTGPRRWLLGSVAERTVQHSKSPVLIVP